MFLATYRYGWWPIDDSVFAHLAERVLQGDVYGVDVHDFHGGYHTYLNALLFKVFGADTAVLRYPFLVVCAVQSMLAAHLLRRSGFWISFLGGISMTTLTFMIFTNPSPNWFALFFAVVIVFLFTECTWNTRTLLFAGVVWGLCFMFRHPSAFFLLLGVVAFMIHRRQLPVSAGGAVKWMPQIAHAALFVIALAAATYSYVMFDFFAFVLFGVPPLVLSTLFLLHQYDTFKSILIDGVWFGVGAFVAVLPMVVYQLIYGDLVLWMQHSFLQGLSMANMQFFSAYSYLDMVTNVIYAGLTTPLVETLVVYHLVIFLVPVVLLLLIVRRLQQRPNAILPPAAVIATFYGFTSFYFQIEFYFFVSFPIILLAFLVMLQDVHDLAKKIIAALLVNFQLAGLFWMSPAFGALKDSSPYVESALDRNSIYVLNSLEYHYQEAVRVIDQYSDTNDGIYVFPFNPEYYFLSNRESPTKALGTTFTVIDGDSYQQQLNMLEELQSQLIIFAPDNFYTSDYDHQLFDHLKNSDEYSVVLVDYGVYFLARTED